MNKNVTILTGVTIPILVGFVLLNPYLSPFETKDIPIALGDSAPNNRIRDSEMIRIRDDGIKNQEKILNRDIARKQRVLSPESFDEYFKELMIDRVGDLGDHDKKDYELGFREKCTILEKYGSPEARGFILACWISRLKKSDDVENFYYEGVQVLGDIDLRRTSIARIIPIYFDSFENLSNGFESRFIKDVLSRNPDETITVEGGFALGLENYVKHNPDKQEEILKIIKDLDLPDFTKKLIDVNFH
jgi:hypothetical protein